MSRERAHSLGLGEGGRQGSGERHDVRQGSSSRGRREGGFHARGVPRDADGGRRDKGHPERRRDKGQRTHDEVARTRSLVLGHGGGQGSGGGGRAAQVSSSRCGRGSVRS